ncbi:hypothetical protein PJM29_30390, partial [Mycobacterium kansasii]
SAAGHVTKVIAAVYVKFRISLRMAPTVFIYWFARPALDIDGIGAAETSLDWQLVRRARRRNWCITTAAGRGARSSRRSRMVSVISTAKPGP